MEKKVYFLLIFLFFIACDKENKVVEVKSDETQELELPKESPNSDELKMPKETPKSDTKMDKQFNELGLKIYTSVCFNCHSLDGSKMVGPTFKGLYGKENHKSLDGRVIDKVDEDYLREFLTSMRKQSSNSKCPNQILKPEYLKAIVDLIKDQSKSK